MGSRQARNIVRSILGTSEIPLSTKQVYELAWKRFPKATVGEQSAPSFPSPPLAAKEHYERKQPPLPPRGVNHPIPSMKHLKTRVLPLLVARSEVEKVYTTRAQATEEPTDAKSKGHSKAATKSASPTTAAKAWLWRIHPTSKDKQVPESPNDVEWKWEAPEKAPAKTHMEMYPLPENIHLNPRRRRARIAKVARDKAWVAEVARAVEAGKRVAERRAAKAKVKVKAAA
ncbi:hypothetical protein FRB96_004680 [Tulasnella sp. 330]|nr:hypothetical protein FRB96_004680 [Tulasnella sp. 330]